MAGTAMIPTNLRITLASAEENNFFFPKKKPSKHIADTGLTESNSNLANANKSTIQTSLDIWIKSYSLQGRANLNRIPSCFNNRIRTRFEIIKQGGK